MLLIESDSKKIAKLAEISDGFFFIYDGPRMIEHRRSILKMRDAVLNKVSAPITMVTLVEEKIQTLLAANSPAGQIIDWQIFSATLMLVCTHVYSKTNQQEQANTALSNATQYICKLIAELTRKSKKSEAHFINLYHAFCLEHKLALATQEVDQVSNYTLSKHSFDFFTSAALQRRYKNLMEVFQLLNIDEVHLLTAHGEHIYEFNEYFSSEILLRKSEILKLYPIVLLHLIDPFRFFLMSDQKHLDSLRKMIATAEMPGRLDSAIQCFEALLKKTSDTELVSAKRKYDQMVVLKKLYLMKCNNGSYANVALPREFREKLVSHQENLLNTIIHVRTLSGVNSDLTILLATLNEYIDYFYLLSTLTPGVDRGVPIIDHAESSILIDTIKRMNMHIPNMQALVLKLMNFVVGNQFYSIWTISKNNTLGRHDLGQFIHSQVKSLNTIVAESIDNFINFAVLHPSNSALADSLFASKKLAINEEILVSDELLNKQAQQYMRELKAALLVETPTDLAVYEREYLLAKIALQDLESSQTPANRADSEKQIDISLQAMERYLPILNNVILGEERRILSCLYYLEILISTSQRTIHQSAANGKMHLYKIQTLFNLLCDQTTRVQLSSSDVIKQLSALQLCSKNLALDLHFSMLKDNMVQIIRSLLQELGSGALITQPVFFKKLPLLITNVPEQLTVQITPPVRSISKIKLPVPAKTKVKPYNKIELQVNEVLELLKSDDLATLMESNNAIFRFVSSAVSFKNAPNQKAAEFMIAAKNAIQQECSQLEWQQFCHLPFMSQRLALVKQARDFLEQQLLEVRYYNAGADDDLHSTSYSDEANEQADQTEEDDISSEDLHGLHSVISEEEIPQKDGLELDDRPVSSSPSVPAYVEPVTARSSEDHTSELSAMSSTSISSSSVQSTFNIEQQSFMARIHMSAGLNWLKHASFVEAWPKLCVAISMVQQITNHRYSQMQPSLNSEKIAELNQHAFSLFSYTMSTPVTELFENELWNFLHAYSLMCTLNWLTNQSQNNLHLHGQFWFRMMSWGVEMIMSVNQQLNMTHSGFSTPNFS